MTPKVLQRNNSYWKGKGNSVLETQFLPVLSPRGLSGGPEGPRCLRDDKDCCSKQEKVEQKVSQEKQVCSWREKSNRRGPLVWRCRSCWHWDNIRLQGEHSFIQYAKATMRLCMPVKKQWEVEIQESLWYFKLTTTRGVLFFCFFSFLELSTKRGIAMKWKMATGGTFSAWAPETGRFRSWKINFADFKTFKRFYSHWSFQPFPP